jgi:L-fuconolactonase
VLPAHTVDAHLHLWRYNAEEFGWIGDDMGSLRRNYLAADATAVAKADGIARIIAVQARPSLQENDFLLSAADACERIAGVVGWIDLKSDDVAETVARYAAHPRFVGVREMVQSEAAGYLDAPSFDRGMHELTARSLAFDLLLRANQLAEATHLVDRHPQQRFVLDHAAKPQIRERRLEPWATEIRELAQRPNVACKLSGLVTEAPWQNWSAEDLQPYLDTCVEAFTPARLMAGSDWPVCLVATETKRWWHTLDAYFSAFSSVERDCIFSDTARSFYRLPQRRPDR